MNESINWDDEKLLCKILDRWKKKVQRHQCIGAKGPTKKQYLFEEFEELDDGTYQISSLAMEDLVRDAIKAVKKELKKRRD